MIDYTDPDEYVDFVALQKVSDRIKEHLGAKTVASLLSVDVRFYKIMATDAYAYSGSQRARIGQIDAIILESEKVMTADELRAWLYTPEPLLNDEKPLDVFKHEGPERVAQALREYARE